MSDGGPGGWETWEWDESLFEGAAPYYRRGRPPYSPQLAEAIRTELSLDGHGRLLDVGCGPGVIALLLVHLFDEIVGLDPDAGMVAEAGAVAAAQGADNATWVQLRAEELPAGLGAFRLITFAQSFHWMDRPRVAATVKGMLDQRGAVVQIDSFIAEADGSKAEPPHAGRHPPVPEPAIDELRRKYLGSDKRAGQTIRNTSPGGENAIFEAAGFLPEREVVVPDGRVIEQTIDDVVAHVFSRSLTAPHLFGGRIADFERDLRHSLADASPDGLFSVPLTDNRIRIRIPANR